MAKVLHTCSGCVPIDVAIIDVYTQLIGASIRAEAAAKKADEASLGKAPYVGENGDWWEWDEEQKTFVDTGIQAATGMTVDDEMSDTSTNPVQNKVVKEYIDEHGGGGSDPEAVKYTEQLLTPAQQAQARTNIGAGTSDFSGNYNDLTNQPTIPTVPVISTDISADAASDTKTASPKAVKTYVDAHGGGGTDPEAVKYTAQSLTDSQKTQARTNIGAQEQLVSGTNIKTVNQTSLLGSGDIVIPQGIQGNTGPQGIQGIPGTPGTPGVTSVEISVDNEVGVPYATATLSNGVLTISLHNIKGAQGNTGASVDYPFTLVNDLSSGGIDKGLTAEMGKVLGNSIIGADTILDTQNQAKESGLSINTSNEWQIFSSAIQSSFLQLTGGTYRIQAVDGQCVYAILNSTTYSDGGTPDFAIGFNVRFTIADNGEETIDVPPGKYLWYRNDSSAPAPRLTLKSNGGLVKKVDIIDNLSSDDTQRPLSAKQGKILAEMDIDQERVKITESGNITIGQESANTSAAASEDFRYPKYPATGYRVKKVYLTGNQSKLVTIGVYTPGVGVSDQQQVQMVNGTTSHNVDIEVPVGSYLCIGNATGLMFSTVGAIYGSYNIDTASDSNADLSFWFEVASESVPIKDYIDQKYASYIPSSLVQIFPKLTGIGDSLMAGYTNQGGVMVNSATARAAGNNWITYLAKRNGLDVHNLAVGSSTAHNWRYADGPSQDNLADITTADIPTDCYFVGIGVNDLRQSLSVGTSADIVSNPENNADSFYGNYDYIIRKCLYYNPKANIFVFTIPDSESGNSPYNNAILYISQLYSQVHCIDLTNTDAFTTGIIASCFANGHYDPLAYNLISSVIENAMNGYIKTNYNLFKIAPY